MIDGVLVENYVASQDLNECVDALLKKGIKHSNTQLIPAASKISQLKDQSSNLTLKV